MALRWLECAALAVLCSAETGFAADRIELPSESGNVVFPHKKHQESVRDCKVCHKTSPGTIKEAGQFRPHTLCIGCHEKGKPGPVSCANCHETRD